jgi:hypothetical protein
MTDAHFDVMRNFWNYAKDHPRPAKYAAETAYVLPVDYGYGFRGPNDLLWGLWPADSLSAKVWSDADALIKARGMNLDIVYETKIDGVSVNLQYRTLIFWNGTTIQR